MTQQQREAIAGMLRASPFDPAGDLREQRPLFDKMVAAAPVPADVVTTPGQLGGVPVISVDIPGTTTGGVILYLHDGFFAIGSAATSVGLASDLARKARMPVVTVDYRLAPEHPLPRRAARRHDRLPGPARGRPGRRLPRARRGIRWRQPGLGDAGRHRPGRPAPAHIGSLDVAVGRPGRLGAGRSSNGSAAAFAC
jgi:hypothetical protein